MKVRRVPLGPGGLARAALLAEAAIDRFIHAEAERPAQRRSARHPLREAISTMTADFDVRNGILTPLHGAEHPALDPCWLPVGLWRRGARATVTGGERVGEGTSVFVEPEPTTT